METPDGADIEQKENLLVFSDRRKRVKMTEAEVKRYINALSKDPGDLAGGSTEDGDHSLKYEFGTICWWLGNCEYLQFIDLQPQLPVLSKDKRISNPDIFAIFTIEGRSFPCFIVVAEFDEERRLTIYPRYLSKLNEYPLLNGYPILFAGSCNDEWTLFNALDFIEKGEVLDIGFEEARRGNVLGILGGDARFQGLAEGSRWFYVIETSEDIALVKQGIVPLNDPIVELSMERPEGDKLKFIPQILHLLPFFGRWHPFEEYAESLVFTGEVLVENRPLHLYQALIFSKRMEEHLKGNDFVDWKRIIRENDFTYSVEDMERMVEYGVDNGMGLGGFEKVLPGIDLPHWLILDQQHRMEWR